MMRAAAMAAALIAPLSARVTSEREVAAVEDAYVSAVYGRDVDALGGFLAADMIYVHASGVAQGRHDYLQGTVAGGWAVLRAHVVERRIVAGSDIAMSQGIIAYDVGHGDRPARYLAIYRREYGQWRLLSWQNTRMGQG